jgi:hypothetical protein
MHTLSRWCRATIALSVLVAMPAAAGEPEAEKVLTLGSVKVAGFNGTVLFQYPEDDARTYRIDVAISKPNGTDPIQSDRLDVWLLARGSRAVAAKDRPRKGPLIEANSAGTTADAMYFFARDVPRQELVAVVVSVDGEPHVFKIPAPPRR